MKFKVTDLKTGGEPDLAQIALKEDWANRLIYCDMDCFAIDQYDNLILFDKCGNMTYCPEGRFRVEYLNAKN